MENYFLWYKAIHVIAVISWMAAMFYMPRLFVYHAEARDVISLERFKIMERRLYYGIMWPSALLTTSFGLILLSYNLPYYLKAPWFHGKFLGVLCLWGYHLLMGYYLKAFKYNNNSHSSFFYRVINEVPVIFLVSIIVLVVVRP